MKFFSSSVPKDFKNWSPLEREAYIEKLRVSRNRIAVAWLISVFLLIVLIVIMGITLIR